MPAAHIANVDLDAIADRAAAQELARLGDLLGRGEETPEEFCRLCQLLHDVGETTKSEHLLRRNLDDDDRSHDLYFKLFGNDKPEQFEAAIESFKSQFNISLTFIEENDFLDLTFHSDNGPPRSDDYSLLTRQCAVRFGYIEQDKIECDITLLELGRTVFHADECLLLFFVNGVWEIAASLDA